MFHVEARMCNHPSQAILGSWRRFRLNSSMLGLRLKWRSNIIPSKPFAGVLDGFRWEVIRFSLVEDKNGATSVLHRERIFEYLACFT